MKITLRKLIRPVFMAAWVVACFCFFQANFKYHFYFLEQNQLFLFSGAYLAEFFGGPAWLSRMSGEFLQQFYHYICVGPAILTLVIWGFGEAMVTAFEKALPERRDHRPRTIIAVLLALTIMTVEARLFVYENAQLASVISLAGGVGMWLLLDLARKKAGKWSAPVFVLACVLCYWLFGYGMLAMILLELIRDIFRKKLPVAAIASVVVAAALAFPAIRYYRLSPKDALLYPGTGKWIKMEPAMKVEKVLKYFNLYSRGEYRWIIDLYEKSKDNKRKEQNLIYSLALSQYQMLPDRLLLMNNPFIGTSIHLGGASSMLVSTMMSELYYLIGDMTYAERGFMHVNNFTLHKRSALAIQRLAEVELVSEDYEAASKFLTMLKKSPIYRRWAIEHTPGTMSEEVKKAIEAKRPFINRAEEVRVGDNCRTMILGLLASNKDNMAALDYLLCTDILENRPDDLVSDYATYGPRDKKLYQVCLSRAKTSRR